MSENSRGFTGWFTPVELMRDYQLNFTEAAMWAEIKALSERSQGCTAGNDHFAAHCEISERQVSKIISRLKSEGLVEEVGFDGRTRVIRAVWPSGSRRKNRVDPTAEDRSESSRQSGTKVPGRVELKFQADQNFSSRQNQPPYISEREEETQGEEKTPVVPCGDVLVPEPPDEPPSPPSAHPDNLREMWPGSSSKPPQGTTAAAAAARSAAIEVLDRLNQLTGHGYRPVDAHLKLILARLAEPGVTLEGTLKMVEHQCAIWGRDLKMAHYLRPKTLFCAGNFAGYYDERDQPLPRTPARTSDALPGMIRETNLRPKMINLNPPTP